ncbi:hypothetical protein LXA43DRAFT_1098451 [Ganoderma leucocontextum]|nr:hypothetical protein LXA43DRAFT_1098451 [Ganoderma leucocontextum]
MIYSGTFPLFGLAFSIVGFGIAIPKAHGFVVRSGENIAYKIVSLLASYDVDISLEWPVSQHVLRLRYGLGLA